MSNPIEPTPSEEKKPACCPLLSRGGVWLWVLLIGLLLVVQWQTVKGMYYRFSGGGESAVNWRTDYDAALAEAAQTGKPVLIDFTAGWCPPCQVMKNEVWPDAEVAQLANEKYIPVLMDVDQPGAAEPARRYAIRSIPTLLVVDAKGDVQTAGSFMSRKEMVSFLKANQ